MSLYAPTNNIKIILALCIPVILSLDQFRNKRILTSWLYDGAGELCPFNLGRYVPPFVTDKVALTSAEFAISVDAESIVREVIEKEIFGRNLVLVGDSLTRQTFISLVCLLYKAGIVEEYHIAWQSDMNENDKRRHFNDARVRLKTGQIFFHPTAGMVNTYDWGFDKASSPIKGTENWLRSCEERKQFILDTHTIKKEFQHVHTFFNETDSRFEKHPLGKNDVIIFNAGLHTGMRKNNLNRIAKLSNCVQEARTMAEDLQWPSLLYMKSSQQHFSSVDGTYSQDSAMLPCRAKNEIANLTDTYFLEDIEKLEGKLPILGKDINLTQLGHLHLGFTKKGIELDQIKIDCTHWAMPGVPRLFVKEIAKTLLQHPNYSAESQ